MRFRGVRRRVRCGGVGCCAQGRCRRSRWSLRTGSGRRECSRSPRWVPSASCQWDRSACQRSLGWSAQKVRHDDRGRFCGCGLTKPRRDKIRQIVETADATGRPPPTGTCLARCAGMVSAPASRLRKIGPDRYGSLCFTRRAWSSRRHAARLRNDRVVAARLQPRSAT